MTDNYAELVARYNFNYENMVMRYHAEGQYVDYQDYKTQVEALRAELARVSKDAERYRWLSTASMEDWSGLSALTPAALKWIDAALAAGKGEGEKHE